MDFVVYEKKTKVIVVIMLELQAEPKFLISSEYVGIYIGHNEYRIIDKDDGNAYFENLNEKVLYLDDFRGRYEE